MPVVGLRIHNATQHNSNIFSTGSPVFSNSDATKIYAITTEEGQTWNYAQKLQGVRTCFTDAGEFSLNRPNCMIDFKLAYSQISNWTVEGMRYVEKVNQTEPTLPSNSDYANQITKTYNITVEEQEYDDYNVSWSSSSSNIARTLIFIPLICLTLWNVI